jgi:phosphoribosylamine--glycine ligase
MGTAMFWDEQNPIFDATLLKMEKTLAAEGFVGYVDINSIVNGNGIYPLEFTCRFGFPTIFIQRAGILTSIAEVLYRLAVGYDFIFKTKNGFQVGVVLVVPPFPYKDPQTFDSFSRDAVVVFKKRMEGGIHLEGLKCVNGEWLIAGEDGTALVVTGTGTTMREAQKQMYNRVANVLIPNSYYRTDIGDRWFEDSDKLWSWNYL